MMPLHALRQAAGALAGERQALGPAVAFGDGPVHELPADTTAIAGGDATALARSEALIDWLSAAVEWISGTTEPMERAPLVRADLHLWGVLAEGELGFEPSVLEGAVPRGAAWIAAMRPHRFFVQAADRLEAAGHERGARLAARLRAGDGNLDVVRRSVETVAVSLDAGSVPALRLRVACVDGAAARQAVMLLHAWRLRRAMGESASAEAFRSGAVLRDGHRVELRIVGSLDTLLGLFRTR
jgi:hypothetical protein